MSVNIDTVFVQKYRSEIATLAAQMESKLENTVIKETVVGEVAWYDQIGHAEAQEKTTRNGDTPITDIPFARRMILIKDYEVHELIDRKDPMKMLAGPVPKVAAVLVAAMHRKKDWTITKALLDTAQTGKDGTTAVPFPASQQVAVNSWTYGAGSGNIGLTISKLIEAKTILDLNQAIGNDQTMNEMCCVVTARQIGNLLATTEATSAEFAEVKALVRGEIDTFMGFKFIKLDPALLPTDGSGYRRVLCYQKAGGFLGVNEEINSDIGPRRDKSNATQASATGGWGAARVEEKRVVEIKCLE
jgi:hypothetical protein